MNAPARVHFARLSSLAELPGRLNKALDKLAVLDSPLYLTLLAEALPDKPEAIYSLGIQLGTCVPAERPVISPVFWGFDPRYTGELSENARNRMGGRSALFAADYGVGPFFWAFMTTLAALGSYRPKVRANGLCVVMGGTPGDDRLHALLEATEPANFQPAAWMGENAAAVSLAKLYEEVRGGDAATFSRAAWLGILPKQLRQQHDVAGSFTGHTLGIAWLIERRLRLL